MVGPQHRLVDLESSCEEWECRFKVDIYTIAKMKAPAFQIEGARMIWIQRHYLFAQLHHLTEDGIAIHTCASCGSCVERHSIAVQGLRSGRKLGPAERARFVDALLVQLLQASLADQVIAGQLLGFHAFFDVEIIKATEAHWAFFVVKGHACHTYTVLSELWDN